MGEVLQQPPVAASPPVDALLHVTYDQRTSLMSDAVVDEHFEIVPLHRTGILELVDHDILQRAADFLVDKWCVAAVDHVFDELLCVAEREVVVVSIDGVDLLCDTSEQSELVEISECELHRVPHSLSLLPQLLRFGDEWCDLLVEGLAFVSVFDGFLDEFGPFLRLGLVDGSVRDITVVALAQLLEIVGHGAACEVAVVEAVLVDERLEAVCQRAHVLVDLRSLGPKLAGVVLEELRIGENRLKLLVTLLIEVAVDIRTEVLDLSDDIPVLVLVESLVDKVHHPAEQRVFVAVDVPDEFVDGLLLHLTVVEAHVDVGLQSELAREVSEDALEETVDGLHAEVVISVEDTVEGECRPLLDVVVCELRHAVV